MNNIDVLRAIAVLAVFIHHIKYFYQFEVPFFGRFGGVFGVQLFFVISGFLIIQSAQRHSLRQYFLHRLFRIYPVYIIVFFTVGIRFGVITLDKIHNNTWELITNVLLLQHLFPSHLILYDSLHVSWTLTVELIWYLLAPLMIVLFRKYLNAALITSFIVSVVWVYCAAKGMFDFLYAAQFSGLNLDLKPYRILFINNSVIALLCYFFIGAFVYYKIDTLKKIKHTSLILTFFSCTAFYYIGVRPVLNPSFITGIGLGALLVLAMKLPTLNLKPIKFMSDISYSFYLTHFTIILIFHDALALESKWFIVWIFIISVGMSAILYRLVEKPMMQMARRLY